MNNLNSNNLVQEFNYNKTIIILMKICLVVFVAFLGLGLALPFLPSGNTSQHDQIIIFISTVAFFGLAAISTWFYIKKLHRTTVIINEEGIWYKHIEPEQGLVRWNSISTVKERPIRQCLDLLDSRGESLLQVEYLLTGFETIRDTLNSKVYVSTNEFSQKKYSKPLASHLFYWVLTVCFLWSGNIFG